MHAVLDMHHELSAALPLGVGFTIVFVFLYARTLSSGWLLVGIVFSAGVNVVLKHTLRHPRPASSLRSGYGMPSHHTQFMAFAVAYTSAHLVSHTRSRQLPAILALLLASVAAVAHGRVLHGYHTTGQVVVGAIVGSVLGVAWLALYVYAGKAFLASWVRSPLAGWGVWGYASVLDGSLPPCGALKPLKVG